ncbi:FAD-dependent oxidoreductase [Gryllotalpicola koreensis]|uniref:F5/8 type C domain-containing protein n=1 Tax=Gryllotalpicola koreensis TaxID=993086 RepID=A0ABP8A541_9MICO
MQSRVEQHDVVVVGGGLAGVCAAVAAARLGSRVALVTNRPVLGGNSSSEIRVWVVGGTAHGVQRFARETGIMGELFLENQYRNPQGNPVYWDQVVLDLVRAEPNIAVHLNTDVREVEMADAEHIRAVSGWTMGSELTTRFEAPVFLDCTGDGLIGALAGAEHRIGREARSEFGESWAPDEPDRELLGSSIFFSSHDTGKPEPFVAPSIARDISSTPILTTRVISTGDDGCNYWWIEWGGELDTVADNERIRDELWGVVYGIWDYIKNSGEFEAENLTLDWVGALPGKREYRRFVGDHVLTQQDLLEQRSFPDAVAFGGWSIDLHPVEGVYAEKPGARQRFTHGTYDIPFRSLYSRNIRNLLFAGRDISASHIAFGSTRVMATCATEGQAAGTAAHLAARFGLAPRELASEGVELLQRTLVREDAPVIGVVAPDPDDLAQRASVSASGALEVIDTTPHLLDEMFELDRDVAIVVPVDPRLDQVELVTDADAASELAIELWGTGKPQNYVPIDRISAHTARVPAGSGITRVRFDFAPARPCNAIVVVRRAAGVRLRLTNGHPYGLLALVSKASDQPADKLIPEEQDQPVTDWQARAMRGRAFALTVAPASNAFAPEKVVGPYQRPYGGPQLWSAPFDAQRAWLALEWQEPQEISSIRVVFNDDVDADLINLHHHRTAWSASPTLVRDYRIEASDGGEWRTIVEVAGNRHRHRVHDIEPITARRLRLVATATNGSPYITVSAFKVFAERSGRSSRPSWPAVGQN